MTRAHSFLRMSRQIAPVCDEMLGCHTLVSNFIYNLVKSELLFVRLVTFGGLKGYSCGISMSTMKVPPSYGVSFYKICEKSHYLLVRRSFPSNGANCHQPFWPPRSSVFSAVMNESKGSLTFFMASVSSFNSFIILPLSFI